MRVMEGGDGALIYPYRVYVPPPHAIERPQTTVMLEVDSIRITQVISNLLTNAAKYTAGGEIAVGCRRDSGDFVIFVRDNGVGLAPEALAQVFTMFTQVESELERSEGGLGSEQRSTCG